VLAENLLNTVPYLNRASIIDHIIAESVQYITDFENNNISSSNIEYRMKSIATLLSKYCKSEEGDSWNITLQNACKTIRENNIIHSIRIRTNLALKCLSAINEYLIMCNTTKHTTIMVKFAYAICNLITDIDTYPKGDLEELFQLIDILHAKNVLPKPKVEVEATLSDSDELCKNSLFKNFRHNIKQNSNNVVFVGGPHGSGKSYTALHLAMELDKTFDINTQIVYSNKEFVELCNKFHKNGLWGKTIIYDEFGGGANAYKWGNEENILFDEYLQKFRYLRLTTIFTARDVKDALARARKRYTHFINLIDVRICEIYKLNSKYDLEKDKMVINPRLFEFEDENNRYLIKRFKVPKVNDEIAKQYEKLRDKKIGQTDLKRIEEDLQFQSKEWSISDMVNDFNENLVNDPRTFKKDGSINVSFLAAYYGVGRKKANVIKTAIEGGK
jgi:DNA polymerase III delta prime subunit